jgi:hypothetical protein
LRRFCALLTVLKRQQTPLDDKNNAEAIGQQSQDNFAGFHYFALFRGNSVQVEGDRAKKPFVIEFIYKYACNN